jgi:hypothetical protein
LVCDVSKRELLPEPKPLEVLEQLREQRPVAVNEHFLLGSISVGATCATLGGRE